ncbi:Zinc finger C2H2 [Penicillium waksmanii]|uniref:Zinc finger C2H2 n=1 Tax=Penicillium waksmanii TaxID=69791 RepID=UPI002546DA2A|nr:Zinc finger C2H2 [Penicillium waksmanii]KAJ5975505.1 Zinc finger C2H2 [Penicillium waksmanii]
MLLYCFTSIRTGEVYKSIARRAKARIPKEDKRDIALEARMIAAYYKHFTLTIESMDNEPMLVLTYNRRFVKGYWRKKAQDIPTYTFYETYREDVFLFLNLLIFFLPMEKYWIGLRLTLRLFRRKTGSWKLSILLRVFMRRQYSGRTLSFPLISLQAKLEGQMPLEKNKTQSESARIRFAGQTNRDTYGRFYAHPASEIDRPANYLRITSRSKHIKNRRGMGIYQSLSFWIELNKPLGSKENQVNIEKKTLFFYRRRVLPQRDLLANIFPKKISLRRALEALEFICKDIYSVVYRATLQPEDGKYLCRKSIDE